MRVTSALWVGAYVRRCNSAGAYATVGRRGADEAGAIFVIVERLDGTGDLYAPAPQSAFAEARPDERLFQRLMESAGLAEIFERIERELRFDPDLWTVTVEDRAGRAFLEVI
jgi:hypothetical protein